ncbi:hypothetical protein GGR52DRAFT_261191 [Hypoxylon sp. FL1284]|nr:hypothetical protein GGR52DRAFT_261191 [Hypoxylon sp. FL1284]
MDLTLTACPSGWLQVRTAATYILFYVHIYIHASQVHHRSWMYTYGTGQIYRPESTSPARPASQRQPASPRSPASRPGCPVTGMWWPRRRTMLQSRSIGCSQCFSQIWDIQQILCLCHAVRRPRLALAGDDSDTGSPIRIREPCVSAAPASPFREVLLLCVYLGRYYDPSREPRETLTSALHFVRDAVTKEARSAGIVSLAGLSGAQRNT